MRFTKEEFDTMVRELLWQKNVSFDMLCHIAEKTLRPTVKNWCAADDSLRGRDYEDDIMQEIHLRLMKTAVPNFLLHDGITGAYNDNPEGFEDWLFTVGKNIKRDFANKVRGNDYRHPPLEGDEGEPPVDGNPSEDRYERIERLKDAFDVILSSNVSIYKVLTWLAHSLCMLEQDVTKIESNELILSAFTHKTLNEMYDMLLSWSDRIPWLSVSPAQDTKIRAALRKKWQSGVSYGETQYCAFFMKQKGKASGKKSVSDWMNRLNDMLRRNQELQPETPEPDPEDTKKTPEDDGDKKGRNGDEASNC